MTEFPIVCIIFSIWLELPINFPAHTLTMCQACLVIGLSQTITFVIVIVRISVGTCAEHCHLKLIRTHCFFIVSWYQLYHIRKMRPKEFLFFLIKKGQLWIPIYATVLADSYMYHFKFF